MPKFSVEEGSYDGGRRISWESVTGGERKATVGKKKEDKRKQPVNVVGEGSVSRASYQRWTSKVEGPTREKISARSRKKKKKRPRCTEKKLRRNRPVEGTKHR